MEFEVIILKKNKEIQIRMEETTRVLQGTKYDVTELHIGKKKMGEILEYGPKDFRTFMDSEAIGSSKTFELAVEAIIRQWNLHE
uniref:DUF2969 domain-containing protein n=1 Tax=Enterococcus alcedinis TaxID=1274384 RepID=UPI001FD96C85|nr:DUF2969 domain-containing protein [Enterococcus alcedinis]